MAPLVETIPVIDADTHLLEPPDLWTSRMPKKYGDLVPHTEWDDKTGLEVWWVSGKQGAPIGSHAHVGWHKFSPDYAPSFSEIEPSAYDPKERLKWMDRYGIHSQILYPNVAMFNSAILQSVKDNDFLLGMIKAYNDYQSEWCSASPDRFFAMTSLPFWDLPATLEEIKRCAAMGHKGVVFSQEPGAFGLPPLVSSHWYPMWALLEEMGLSVNFHIASGLTEPMRLESYELGRHAAHAGRGVNSFTSNVRTVVNIIIGGLCHKFPNLNFVSVESGGGWIPFAISALDWQWINFGVPEEHPEYDLLPTEYFKRQIYGCFWFEGKTAIKAVIDQIGDDNLMYETDFPHPTSMVPGPGTHAEAPNDFIQKNFGDFPESTMRKLLHDTAARVYHLD